RQAAAEDVTYCVGLITAARCSCVLTHACARLVAPPVWQLQCAALAVRSTPRMGETCMALKDQIALGISLPHRSPEPITVAQVRQVAQRAETVGFGDLWVTNNTLDPANCFDSLTLLTYAAAITSTIRVGVSVLVLPVYNPIHVAHQVATLDYLSGGRAVLGV